MQTVEAEITKNRRLNVKTMDPNAHSLKCSECKQDYTRVEGCK